MDFQRIAIRLRISFIMSIPPPIIHTAPNRPATTAYIETLMFPICRIELYIYIMIILIAYIGRQDYSALCAMCILPTAQNDLFTVSSWMCSVHRHYWYEEFCVASRTRRQFLVHSPHPPQQSSQHTQSSHHTHTHEYIGCDRIAIVVSITEPKWFQDKTHGQTSVRAPFQVKPIVVTDERSLYWNWHIILSPIALHFYILK